MKYILIFLLVGYKKIISPLLDVFFGPGRGCRFEETCSSYSMRVIAKKGAIRGIALSVARVLKCQPFYSGSLKYESI